LLAAAARQAVACGPFAEPTARKDNRGAIGLNARTGFERAQTITMVLAGDALAKLGGKRARKTAVG
jgi:hypothetical protein